MVNFPEPVAQALHILRSGGILANVYRLYGSEHIQFIISLPDVEIKEILDEKFRFTTTEGTIVEGG